MGTINEKEFLDELVFCLKQEDVVKAKALLQFVSDANVNVLLQKRALAHLAQGPDKVVFQLLEFLTKLEISDTEIQEGIYDLILEKAYGNTDLVLEYITENDKKTRLQFIRATGELRLDDLGPALAAIIHTETNTDIKAAAVKALGLLRQEINLPLFSSLSTHPDFAVRKAAIFAIAEMKSQSATDHLLQFIGEDPETNTLTVEALADIQDLYALEKLTELLASPVTLVRDTAIDQLIKLGSKATPLLTHAFKNAEADYMVHLLTTLGYVQDPAAIAAILDVINTQPKDPNIRQAAYEAMERIPSPKTAICLAQGLQDPVEAVRMSAARAVDRNLSKPLIAGLKNIIKDQGEGAKLTVASLIDSGAGSIFNFLANDASFQSLAKAHVMETAAPATRKAFLKHMAGIGQTSFIKAVTQETPDADNQESRSRIIVVDDSKMMLKLYQNKLSGMGFTAEVYHRPEDAIPKILGGDVDLVITDLNMPNISGLELTATVRKKFTRNDLPILMITTQSDFISEKEGGVGVNDTMLKKSGINKVLHKPFSDEALKDTILEFITP